MTQCIPIRDLKNTAEISEMCRKSNSPITITKNGYSDMVIMSTEVYERMRLYSVYEKLMQAEDDIAEGRVSDAHSSLNQLRATQSRSRKRKNPVNDTLTRYGRA